MIDNLTPENQKETTLPIVTLRDGPIFPHNEPILIFGRPKSIAALKAAFAPENLEKMIFVVSQKDPSKIDPTTEEVFSIGTLCKIKNLLQTNGDFNVLVQALGRAKLLKIETTEPFWIGKVSEVKDEIEKTDELTAIANELINEFQKAGKLGKNVDFLTYMRIMSNLEPEELADQIAAILDIKMNEKQELLEINNVKERLLKVTEHLVREIKILEIERNIAVKTQAKFDQSMRETVLRERKRAIEKELGEEDSEAKEIRSLREKVVKAQMPTEVREKAEKEIKRLEQMNTLNPEAGYIRTYLDWLIEMPWAIKSSNAADIRAAMRILDEDHYGLEKIKERIVEYLAVMRLKSKDKKEKTDNPSTKKKNPHSKNEPSRKGSVAPTILCFVGPPGVGKTSIGKSIARALGRKFIRVSLGGIRDEAEIRGHRRTYVGALPGRIIQGIKQAGTRNPVFMLDEIDKVGADFRGDPSAALLEALDPEQNSNFSDHYLEVPFDLSDVMFITTCNMLDTIPPALLDRLEVIHFPGYTEEEKFHIAKDFLIKKQVEANGLKDYKIEIEDEAIRQIINRYTREAGVRSLEREIATILRKIAKEIAEKPKRKDSFIIDTNNLHRYLGPYKFTSLLAEKRDEVGMATGLFWTEAGGGILFIEVALMPGKGNLQLTGQLGDVMQESCKAALSYARSHTKDLDIDEKFFQKTDIHVHVPEGAVPKDGPSAGIAITTAIVSALTKISVRREVGMTGEITLRGRVLEIGGIKEKIIAAHRAGLKTIIMPADNKKDLEDIPKSVLKDLKFIFVKHMDEVLKVALSKPISQSSPQKTGKKA